MPARIIRAAAAALALSLFSGAALAETAAPPGAKVYFIEPKDGAEVTSPVTVKFGLAGMGVAPAGVDKPKTGHHHVFIDAKLDNPAEPIPADDQHKHFGGGQTETVLTLSPGKHTLQLVVGDMNHVPLAPPVVSDVITIEVK
jgi:Domain of unknown function (DUF4399)